MDQDIREEIEALKAETFALQAIIVAFTDYFQRGGHQNLIDEVFEDAAQAVEAVALGGDDSQSHYPQALSVIDHLRDIVTKMREPKSGL